MSSLTEQERHGLEEVFLSISSNQKLGNRLKHFARHLSAILKPGSFKEHLKNPVYALKKGHSHLKQANILHLNPKKTKKKKSLS